MGVSRAQISSLNFGYLSGRNLLQYCPEALLITQYNIDPNLFTDGVNQAYADLKSRLSSLYDLTYVLSNANQFLLNQTGSIQINIADGTYVDRIMFNQNPLNVLTNSLPLSGFTDPIIDLSPQVQCGSTLGTSDLLPLTSIENGWLWFVNKYFATSTTLYFTLTGQGMNIKISASTGVVMPPVSSIAQMNQDGAFTYVMPANSYLYQVFAEILLSTPSVKIGTTAGGSDIYALTLINDSTLIPSTQFFAVDTTLYFTVSNGSANFRLDIGFNFVAPQAPTFQYEDDFLKEILSKLAIEKILGSNAATNKQMMAIFDRNEAVIHNIETKNRVLTLPAAPLPLQSLPETIYSSFHTIG